MAATATGPKEQITQQQQHHQSSGSAADLATTSADSARSPSSTHTPFLHNLSQRFRKGSNASSNTSDSQNQNHAAAAADKQTVEGSASGSTTTTTSTTNAKAAERARANASRAAKRYLMTIVRSDWEYPPTTTSDAAINTRPDGNQPISYRLRDVGSDDELLSHPHHHTKNHHNRSASSTTTKRRSKTDPYRFENPDSVAEYVREREVKRKRIMYEQMQWNDGLRHWVNQRDAWTGAVWEQPGHQQQQQPKSPLRQDGAEEARAAKRDPLSLILEKGDIPDSGSTTATSLDSSTTDGRSNTNPNQHLHHRPRYAPGTAVLDTPPHSPSGGTSHPDTSSSSLDHTTTITAATTEEPAASATTNGNKLITTSTTTNGTPDPTRPGPYLPLYPPLFPSDNVLRTRIQPSTYSLIYSKVVVQCLTPNIPVPLPDMVRALVAGWKEEGQWPPQSTTVTGLPLGAQGSGKRLGSGLGAAAGGAFARWRRERAERKARESAGGVVDMGALEPDGGGTGGGGQEAEGEEQQQGEAGRKGHRLRSSISSVVKRALGKEGAEGWERRRESEVGLSMGFEEEDLGAGEGAIEGDGEAAGEVVVDDDKKLNERLLEKA